MPSPIQCKAVQEYINNHPTSCFFRQPKEITALKKFKNWDKADEFLNGPETYQFLRLIASFPNYQHNPIFRPLLQNIHPNILQAVESCAHYPEKELRHSFISVLDNPEQALEAALAHSALDRLFHSVDGAQMAGNLARDHIVKCLIATGKDKALYKKIVFALTKQEAKPDNYKSIQTGIDHLKGKPALITAALEPLQIKSFEPEEKPAANSQIAYPSDNEEVEEVTFHM